jgi:hypothetical protein
MKECQIGVERCKQCETAILSALALCKQFTVRGDVLERVEVFKYLGRLIAQDDDSCGKPILLGPMWVRSQVHWNKNVLPFVAARF